MGKDMNIKPENEDYQFMRETIKKRPNDRRRLFRKGLMLFIGGVFFGLCAAGAFAWALPEFAERFAEEKGLVSAVKLTTASSDGQAETEEKENTVSNTDLNTDLNTDSNTDSYTDIQGGIGLTQDSSSLEKATDPLIKYQQIYRRVLDVAKKPRKALVRVTGTSGQSIFWMLPFFTMNRGEGIIFLESSSCIYILTNWEPSEKTSSLQVTFADSSTARAHLCQTDDATGLSVMWVRTSELSDSTKKAISVVSLAQSFVPEQAEPVIAIGSPSGEFDGVLYGIVTSTSGRFSAADAEYQLMITDIQGCISSKGVLINTKGEIVGVIKKNIREDVNVIQAFSIAQLRLRIEQMINKQAPRYLGIYGVSIPAAKAASLGISKGIYIEKVDKDSPAMAAGIQRGDIITALDGSPVSDMQEYSTYLQNCENGLEISMQISRYSGDGELGKVELTVKVNEK
ncbi:MAG: S1C family serine protease [Blautia sp.]